MHIRTHIYTTNKDAVQNLLPSAQQGAAQWARQVFSDVLYFMAVFKVDAEGCQGKSQRGQQSGDNISSNSTDVAETSEEELIDQSINSSKNIDYCI